MFDRVLNTFLMLLLSLTQSCNLATENVLTPINPIKSSKFLGFNDVQYLAQGPDLHKSYHTRFLYLYHGMKHETYSTIIHYCNHLS